MHGRASSMISAIKGHSLVDAAMHAPHLIYALMGTQAMQPGKELNVCPLGAYAISKLSQVRAGQALSPCSHLSVMLAYQCMHA